MWHFTKIDNLERELAKKGERQQRNKNYIVGSKRSSDQKTDDLGSWYFTCSRDCRYAAKGTWWRDTYDINKECGCDKKDADVPEEVTRTKHFTLKKL